MYYPIGPTRPVTGLFFSFLNIYYRPIITTDSFIRCDNGNQTEARQWVHGNKKGKVCRRYRLTSEQMGSVTRGMRARTGVSNMRQVAFITRLMTSCYVINVLRVGSCWYQAVIGRRLARLSGAGPQYLPAVTGGGIGNWTPQGISWGFH